MTTYSIGILGGSGPQGKGLAYRFAKAGHSVILGSRDPERAAGVADEINNRIGGTSLVSGAENQAAALNSEVVLIVVPYAAHQELLQEVAPLLEGKVVIDCVNPLAFDADGPYSKELADKSSAEEAQRILSQSKVTAAFHLVSAVNLWNEEEFLSDEDILVCGDDPESKVPVLALAKAVSGKDGIDVGVLRMARYIEPLTAMIISINKKYKAHAGIKIAGLHD
jgi:8-hydroxy-5-deazaflavin:NADPH oxidoreductase